MAKNKAAAMQDTKDVNEGFDAPALTPEEKEAATKLQLEREEAEKAREEQEAAEKKAKDEEAEKEARLKIEETKDDESGWEAVDTGDFDFVELGLGESFVGRYITQWTSEEDGGTDKVSGLLFLDVKGRKKVLSNWYSLVNFFVEKKSLTPVRWEEKPLFKITVVDKVKLDKGHVYKVNIDVKY